MAWKRHPFSLATAYVFRMELIVKNGKKSILPWKKYGSFRANIFIEGDYAEKLSPNSLSWQQGRKIWYNYPESGS